MYTGFRLVKSVHMRYISSIYRDAAGGLEIWGKAGIRRYIGYSMREARTRYNAIAKTRLKAN